MSDCKELRPRAAGIASLPEGDPERESYLRHARGCDACLTALREGERLMRLLEASPLPAPSRAALQRAAAPILSALRPARPRWVWVAAAAAVPGFLLPLALAGHLDGEGRTAAVVALLAAGLLAASAGALRAGAMVVLTASAAFALAAGGIPGWPFGRALQGGELSCTFFELAAAALPLAATAFVFRGNQRPGALAQAAAAGALAGQAALHLACAGSHNVTHLWVFHVGGVLAAALVGWAVEGRLAPARS